MSMTIYLVRHTTPDVEASKILYGQTDLNLDQNFDAEAEEVKQTIGDDGLSSIFYSPLKRCKQLAKKLPADIHIEDDRLLEINYGDWEMKTFHELGADLKEWAKYFDHKAAPNGESLMDVKSRLCDFWQDNIQYDEGKSIAIVTHGVVMRVILCYLLEMPLKNIFRIQFGFGKVIKIELQESGRTRVNI
ncbi:histidine phosphatase family protein [Flammeovirga yaeyamensis]|uniref:phosphoglycerate mutase (2,3-diphosphoglycerate-dependent) n=1 Tax=Flammeovirga yaeyamensis TaxID=367791 RepID=A0AAX1N3J5_9BACT|nr:alpha-ribazole phosphatase family protein [Flammeovirga yaeyamensis]NMF37851.1 alpha-ribazole phosphatase family protein [Flammeovirga yaeyamensis]QWG01787.1 histidine phosphatase family protein [Flammeovirga yaeyamensis]